MFFRFSRAARNQSESEVKRISEKAESEKNMESGGKEKGWTSWDRGKGESEG